MFCVHNYVMLIDLSCLDKYLSALRNIVSLLSFRWWEKLILQIFSETESRHVEEAVKEECRD